MPRNMFNKDSAVQREREKAYVGRYGETRKKKKRNPISRAVRKARAKLQRKKNEAVRVKEWKPPKRQYGKGYSGRGGVTGAGTP